MKIELYLDGNKVDISQDIDFVLNKQYTELTDLTSIIVDYSKTIRIPMTPRNNELFNYIFKLDHQVLVGQDIINYDPSQKIPMYMTYNGSEVMDGYAILDKIDLNSRMYEVNLYGQLGKIFSILKEKNLGNYLNDGSAFWTDVVMNTYNIDKSFANDDHSLDWTSTDWTDFFGWAPQMIGNNDDLDTTCYEDHSSGDVKNFADVINQKRGITYGDVYVGDGLDMNSYLEVRTYMCRPYVYVDKLIQLVMTEINSNPVDYDGYTMSLSGDWFTAGNPYYSKLVYFPGKESLVGDGDSTEGNVVWNNQYEPVEPHSFLPSVSSSQLDGYTYTTSGNVITISGPSCTLTINGDNIVMTTEVTNCDDESGWTSKGVWGYYNSGNDDLYSVYIPHIDILDGNGNLLQKMYLCDDTLVSVKHRGTNWQTSRTTGNWSRMKRNNSNVVVPVSCSNFNQKTGSTCKLTQYFNFGRIPLTSSSFQFRIGMDRVGILSGTILEENIASQNYRFLHPFKNNRYRNKTWNDNSSFSAEVSIPRELVLSGNTYRSMSTWTVRDILGNDFNPFLWLINYVKKFRLIFDIDYAAKTITLKDDYFSDVTYKDVIVDYSKPVLIEPIINKYNKVKFEYKDSESKKGVQYLKNYGVDYGDILINTGIDVNNETLELNPDKEEGVFIPVRMDCLTWRTLNSTDPLRYMNVLHTSKVINTLNKKNEIQYFPFYAFRWNNQDNEAHTPAPFYSLTDDTPSMRSTGKYTYIDHNNNGWDTEVETTQDGVNVYYLMRMAYIPQFDNYYAVSLGRGTILYWLTFAVPAEVYNSSPSASSEQICVYDRWKDYLNQIFNVNNKKVTCYVRISYPEFINFKFNQFFVIDNNVFLVNKIIDFNPNSPEPTKVELIQVNTSTQTEPETYDLHAEPSELNYTQEGGTQYVTIWSETGSAALSDPPEWLNYVQSSTEPIPGTQWYKYTYSIVCDQNTTGSPRSFTWDVHIEDGEGAGIAHTSFTVNQS